MFIVYFKWLICVFIIIIVPIFDQLSNQLQLQSVIISKSIQLQLQSVTISK